MQHYSKHPCELTNDDMEMTKGPGNWKEKLKFGLESLVLLSSKNYRSFLFLRTKGAMYKEILKQKNSKYWYIVHPFSILRLYWEIFTFFIYLILSLFIPFRCSFLNSYMARYYIYAGKSVENIIIASYVDFALSMICVIDTFGFFITGYFDTEKKETVIIPQKIFQKYISGGFILDFTSSIPVDSLIISIAGITFYANLTLAQFVFIKLYNVYRIVRFRSCVTYLLHCAKLEIFSMLIFRVILALLIYFVTLQWLVSLSLTIPQMTIGDRLYKNTSNVTLSWIQSIHLFEMSLVEQYRVCLIKEVQNNLGANEPASGLLSAQDYLLALISIMVGRIYFIFFFITILQAVTAASALKVKFRMILDQLRSSMKQKDVPVYLKKRLNRFYLYRFQAHYFSNRAMLGRLTESLRKEISMYTCQRLLHNTEVFQSIPKKVLSQFVQRMNRELYFPKDVIIQGNTFGECMYFICSGSVAVETLSEKEICTLEDGDFFGEIALIVPNRRRTATVKAVTITEVYRLEYSDYKYIIELYPDVYNRLEKTALERFKTTTSVEDYQKRSET